MSKKKEFDRAFKDGQSFYSRILGFKAADNGLGRNRFGIMVGLKISKKAVIRNLIKRKIRVAIYNELKNLKGSKDVVIITLPLILDKDIEEIKKDVNLGFKRLKLL